MNGRSYLIHDGHGFSVQYGRGGRTYWKCSVYKRFKCQARVITKKINGWDAASITCGVHSHPVQPYKPRKQYTRAKTKKLKSKQTKRKDRKC